MSQSLVDQNIHIVWATKELEFNIPDKILLELYPFIAKTIKTNNGYLYAIGGSTNHLHLLTRLPSDISLSAYMQMIKSFSSNWLRKTGLVEPSFHWQDGYSAFSVQEDRILSVTNYIERDHLQHREKSYEDELRDLLKQQSILFKSEYLLKTTYTKLLTHLIWSTKSRQPCLNKEIRPELYRHIETCLTEERGKLIEIGGIDDHIHLLIDTPKHVPLCEIVKSLKTKSNHWIQNNSSIKDFSWQKGFAGFSVSLGSKDAVRKYIQQQEEHHRVKSSQEEWDDFIKKTGIAM